MTPTLLAGLALAAVCGISVAACYLALPRRLTAEEWVLHRRALAAAAEPRASRPVGGGVAWRPRWLASDQYRAIPTGSPMRAHGHYKFAPATSVAIVGRAGVDFTLSCPDWRFARGRGA